MFDRYIALRKIFEYLIFHLSRFRTLKLRDLICKTHNKNLSRTSGMSAFTLIQEN